MQWEYGNEHFPRRGSPAGSACESRGSVYPELRPHEWTECTDFLSIDPKQVRVFAGNDLTMAILTVPGCECGPLSCTLLRLLDGMPRPLVWVVSLSELEECDAHFLRVLLAIGKCVRRGGGRLVIEVFDAVSVSPDARNSFLKECAKRHIKVGPLFGESVSPFDQDMPSDGRDDLRAGRFWHPRRWLWQHLQA